MKTLLVIVSKDQQQYAEKMNAAIEKLTVKPDGVLVVLERPSPAEINATKRAYTSELVTILVSTSLPEYVGRPQMNYHVPYFCAGHARNLALRYPGTNDYAAVIFIDGDCYPEPDLIKAHKELLDSEDPVITVGRRNEAKYAWHDQRKRTTPSQSRSSTSRNALPGKASSWIPAYCGHATWASTGKPLS